MERFRDDEVSKPPSDYLQSRRSTVAISSLKEAWCRTLDEYAVDMPLYQVILPLMRDCFFGGAIYALLLLQKGHGDQLACDIAGFITEEPRS
jgi:hypothetical protein